MSAPLGRLIAAALVLSTALYSVGCSSAKKRHALTADELRGKTVALVDVTGAKEAQIQVEVALVNEIIENGRFQIIDRRSVQTALIAHPAESDWPALGRELHADLILAIEILEFNTDKREGYDAVEEEDSLLSKEHREDRDKKWRKYQKVKQREGYVKIHLRFFDVKESRVALEGESEARAAHNSRDGDLPRAQKLLENLTAAAFKTYFQGL